MTLMANRAAKMRTAKENRRTRTFHKEPCFAAGGSMDPFGVTSGKKKERVL